MKHILFKQISSLEKVFLTSKGEWSVFSGASALKGESFSYQIAFQSMGSELHYLPMKVRVESRLEEYISIRQVENVPSQLPAYKELFGGHDDDYITIQPGLFPDLLHPLSDTVEAVDHVWKSLWINIRLPQELAAGIYPIKIVFEADGEQESCVFRLQVLDACLPEQNLVFTQWFHADCLYTYYHEEPFSEGHWTILKNFIQTAADNGINMILTPLFTPALDTEVGGERPTIQLVGISKEGNRYTFDFSKLDRWIALCRECGIQYFEMPQFFTQWGAKFTPKILVKENGKLSKKFGWHVAATAPAYKEFLDQFIPALLERLRSLGVDQRVYFHVSDEPTENNRDDFMLARNLILDLLKGYPIIDTISHFSLFKEGLVDIPVVALEHLPEFLETPPARLWAYNCCAQTREVSNRFMAMPSYRNRILGLQLYKFQIEGFLQWGYNFYYSARSRKQIDPFVTTDALNAFPSGDPFSVYPGADGRPLESIRLLVFNEGLQDVRALELLEKLAGREAALRLLEEETEEPLTITSYPRSAAYLLRLRERINQAIEANIEK